MLLNEEQFPCVFPKSKFTYAAANKILKAMMGGLSLKEVVDDGKTDIKYHTIMSWIMKGAIDEDDVTDKNKHFYQFRKAYLAVKERQAEDIYEKMQEIERKIEDGDITPQQGKAILGSLKFRITHMDFGRYGDQKKVKKEVKHTLSLDREVITGPKKVIPLHAKSIVHTTAD